MIASDVTDRASRILFDITQVRWPKGELLDYVSDGQRQVVLYRPDANPSNKALQLVGGSRQTIPADGIRLLRVVRNMGVNGTTPGRAIRVVDRTALDNELPNWHVDGASNVIEHYVFDNVDRKHFYVYPPAAGTNNTPANVWVEAVYSATPPDVTDDAQTLALEDHYLNAILDWTLYRCYSKDASYAGNLARAGAHLQAFAAALDVNMKIEWNAAIPTSGSVAVPMPSQGA